VSNALTRSAARSAPNTYIDMYVELGAIGAVESQLCSKAWIPPWAAPHAIALDTALHPLLHVSVSKSVKFHDPAVFPTAKTTHSLLPCPICNDANITDTINDTILQTFLEFVIFTELSKTF
jgi:hypothetical protein